MDTKVERKFRLSKRLLEQLDFYKINFHIKMSTIIGMGIYHGIKLLQNGYYPYRNHKLKKLEKKRVKIFLPEKTWIEFDNAMEHVVEKRKEKKIEVESIPDGELVEMFIRMELKKYIDFFEINKVYNGSEMFYIPYPKKIRTMTVDLPDILYDELDNELKYTGLDSKDIYRYYLLRSLCQEVDNNRCEMIDSDADLIKYIDELGLNRLKTMTLIKNLMKSGKIRFLYDNSMDY